MRIYRVNKPRRYFGAAEVEASSRRAGASPKHKMIMSKYRKAPIISKEPGRGRAAIGLALRKKVDEGTRLPKDSGRRGCLQAGLRRPLCVAAPINEAINVNLCNAKGYVKIAAIFRNIYFFRGKNDISAGALSKHFLHIVI